MTYAATCKNVWMDNDNLWLASRSVRMTGVHGSKNWPRTLHKFKHINEQPIVIKNWREWRRNFFSLKYSFTFRRMKLKNKKLKNNRGHEPASTVRKEKDQRARWAWLNTRRASDEICATREIWESKTPTKMASGRRRTITNCPASWWTESGRCEVLSGGWRIWVREGGYKEELGRGVIKIKQRVEGQEREGGRFENGASGIWRWWPEKKKDNMTLST